MTNNTFQETLTAGIYANTEGFSIVLVQADFSNPTRYNVLYEVTNSNKISYEEIKKFLADIETKYLLHRPYQMNDLPSLQTALGGKHKAEIKELNLINEYTKIQSYWNDKRLSFDKSLEADFLKELTRFSGGTENHKVQALFLALSLERKCGYVLLLSEEDKQETMTEMQKQLANLRYHYGLDSKPQYITEDMRRSHSPIPEHLRFRQDY